ncbi:MAG: Bor/Iss family lipoprotein [Alkalispirochaetaceae bacterium]
MKRWVKVAAVIAAVLAVAGCTTFELSGVSIVEDMPAMTPVGDFETTVKVHELLGNSGGINLVNVTATEMNDEIYDAIRREVQRRSGDAAINVQIRYEASFIDLLLNGVTFGIYAPATATVSGTVVSYDS